MKDIDIILKFIDDLRNADRYGGAVVVPKGVRDWKKLDDGSYMVLMDAIMPEIPLLNG